MSPCVLSEVVLNTLWGLRQVAPETQCKTKHDLLMTTKELCSHLEHERRRLRKTARQEREVELLRQRMQAVDDENRRLRTVWQALLVSHPGAFALHGSLLLGG